MLSSIAIVSRQLALSQASNFVDIDCDWWFKANSCYRRWQITFSLILIGSRQATITMSVLTNQRPTVIRMPINFVRVFIKTMFSLQCAADKKWGDWRPHLAMMLSNQTSSLELDRKAILTLGDTLGKCILYFHNFVVLRLWSKQIFVIQ